MRLKMLRRRTQYGQDAQHHSINGKKSTLVCGKMKGTAEPLAHMVTHVLAAVVDLAAAVTGAVQTGIYRAKMKKSGNQFMTVKLFIRTTAYYIYKYMCMKKKFVAPTKHVRKIYIYIYIMIYIFFQ